MMFGAAAVRAQRMAGDAAPHYTGGVLRTPLVVWGTFRICSACFSTLFQLTLKLQVELTYLRELGLVWLFPEPALRSLHQTLDDAP